MIQPLTMAILDAFGDGPERTYDEIRIRATAMVRDATDFQIYLEVMRLVGLEALESTDMTVIPGDTGKMGYRITPSGVRCRNSKTDPAMDPALGVQMNEIMLPSDPDPVEKKPKGPTPRDWEW